MKKYKVDDVYGVSRWGVPSTYLSRAQVDDRFLNEIMRDQHIVIYGSSKQGKSSLLRTCLRDEDYISVHCSNDWTKEKLYGSILKEIGIDLTESSSITQGSAREHSGNLGGEGKLPWLAKISAGLSSKWSHNSNTTLNSRSIPLDLNSGSDIIRILEDLGFDKFIVVEDFHYLSTQVQRSFASDLKAFYERATSSFIIVGVWLEANRLIVYNGDLASRITSIPADTWTLDEMAKVIRSGEPHMNARFAPAVVNALTERAQFNIGTLQEAVRQMFLTRSIYNTPEVTATFDEVPEVEAAYAYVAEQLASRYANVIKKFSEGLRDQALHMYKWVMHAVIYASAEERRAGLKTMDIVRHVQTYHPRGARVFQNSIISALTNVAKVQSHADITPIVFDYDDTHTRLSVVDNGFLVYLDSTVVNESSSFLASFSNE